jgi:hypothetical protein
VSAGFQNCPLRQGWGFREYRQNRLGLGFASPPLASGRRISASQGLIIVIAFAVAATAQEKTKDLGDASLEELESLQVYSASKHLQSTSDAPSSVSLITADEIHKNMVEVPAHAQGNVEIVKFSIVLR